MREKTVFISNQIPEVGVKLLKDAGLEVEIWNSSTKITQEELIKKSQNIDYLLSVGQNKLDEHFFKECKNLKIVSLLSVGYDHVDIKSAKKYNVPVTNTPDVLSAATADTAFLLMLASSRKAFYHHKRISKGEWKKGLPSNILGIELHGKTLGVFGLGRIGMEMAKRCIGAYGMKIIYHNRNRNEQAERELNATWVSFEDLLAQSDVLSVHSQLSKETKEKFNYDAFSKMRSNAIFINTSRGQVHQEQDLIKALQEGLIWGAGLDVTNPEPMDANNPLLDMPSVAILPHIGSATVETRDAMASLAAENIIAAFKGEELLSEV